MRLLHYSAAPFHFDRSRAYSICRYANLRYDDKPSGLWVSVVGDDDWPAWCRDEKFSLEGLEHAAEIILRPEANILVIDELGKLDDFNVEYRRTQDDHELRNIDWAAVKSSFDGIVIAPYHWERRLDYMWYYTWDCASGVIWNLQAVRAVMPVTLPAEVAC